MKEYLKRLNEKNRSEHFLWLNRINVYSASQLSENINIENVLSAIEQRLPSSFLSNIESIYIGDFDILKQRDMDAMYADGAIYIRPDRVVSEEDLVDDIIHEISHSMEEAYALDVYGDGQIEREFIIKRMQLFAALEKESVPFFPRDYFLNTEYSEEFDDYLYRIVGYPLLTSLTINMFASPYGATSLREYFANAFEKYFMGEHEAVKKISPQAYKKIKEMVDRKEDEEYGNI
jgi:hypothetical protein